MRYAITGPTSLTPRQQQLVRRTVWSLRSDIGPSDQFTSGAARGTDTIGALAAIDAGFQTIRLTIPAPTDLGYNEQLEHAWKQNDWPIEYARQGKTDSETYMLRNDLLIAHCDILLAFPRSLREELRSGTWATIRRARKKGCEIRGYPLNGDPSWEEPAHRLGALRQLESIPPG